MPRYIPTAIIALSALTAMAQTEKTDTIMSAYSPSRTVITESPAGLKITILQHSGDSLVENVYVQPYSPNASVKSDQYTHTGFETTFTEGTLGVKIKKRHWEVVTGGLCLGFVYPYGQPADLGLQWNKSLEISWINALAIRYRTKLLSVSLGFGFDWRNYKITTSGHGLGINNEGGITTRPYPDYTHSQSSRIKVFSLGLPLDAPGAVAPGQLLHLGHGDHVVVPLDGVLQGGGRHGELHRRLGGLAGQQGVDQAAAEGVAAAHPVDDVQLVLLGEAVLAGGRVVQHGGPAVVKGGVALPEGDGHLLKAEPVRQLLGHGLVALVVDLAAVNVGVLRLDAEHVLGILLVGNAHVHVLAQVRHGLTGLIPRPQLAPVVQVAGDLHALGLRRLAGLLANFHHVGPQGRGDAGEVEPVHALENLVPVEVGGGGLLDGGVGPIVDAHAAPLGRALLVEVDAHPVAAPDDHAGVHPVPPQGVHRRLPDGVGGELGDVGRVQAVVGQGDRHVGLAAAEGEFQAIRLDEPLIIVGLEPDHQLAEGDDFRHDRGPPLRFLRIFCTAR